MSNDDVCRHEGGRGLSNDDVFNIESVLPTLESSIKDIRFLGRKVGF